MTANVPVPDPFGAVRRRFRVARQDIWYLHFIVESYEGLATVSTVDRLHGIIEVVVPSCRVAEANLLLEELGGEIPMDEVTAEEESPVRRVNSANCTGNPPGRKGVARTCCIC